ncbi:MAG: hypothetical protein HZC55_18980 [Verrucomicrobia bacterium]|nr:hypothetical protein [Verrucomicrobiota bacterium]
MLLAATGVAVDRQQAARQGAEQAAGREELSRAEGILRRAREQRQEAREELAVLERETNARREALALQEAGSALKLWANRVTALKRLLEELPGQGIPEMRLLDPIDWVRAVRTLELDTPDSLRTALSALRLIARQRMAVKLQDALRRYTEASGGELPPDIHALGPYLTAPADASLLARYALTRAGRIAARDEILIKELPIADAILSVGLDTYHATQNLNGAPEEPDPLESWSRMWTAMGVAFGGSSEAAAPLANLAPTIKSLGVKMDRLMEDMDPRMKTELGELMKGAARRYAAERGGEAPATLAHLLPYVPQLEAAIDLARPLFAEMEYARDHQFQLPTDPAQLQPYLDRPFDRRKALEMVNVKLEGDTLTTSFEFSWGSK